MDLKSINKTGLFSHNNAKYFIPISNAIEFPNKNLLIDPYVFGALLGDGSLHGQIHFSNNDQDIINRIKNNLPKTVIMKKISNDYDYSIVGNRKKNKWIKNEIKEIILNYKLSVKSEHKFIPNDYKFSSIHQRIELLRGLMDTDGYTSQKANISQFSSSSEQLCDDVAFLIQSLGGITFKHSNKSKYTYKEEKKVGKVHYTLTVRMPKNIIPFYCKRKAQNFLPRTKYLPARSIKSIEYVDKRYALCISTTCPSGLYITNNCVVTHNTMQALAWLQLHKELSPIIIVCPASLKLNWYRETIRWIEVSTQPLIAQGKDAKLKSEEEDIIIINYDVLPSWIDILKRIEPQVLIIDEIHYIKNNRAQRTCAIKRLAKNIPHIIGLSGTPIINRPIEAYNACKIIDPTALPDYWTFAHQYCAARYNGFGWDLSGASNTEELNERLTHTIMIRRRKEDVLPELPDKIYSYIPIELDNRREYSKAEEHFISYIRLTQGKEKAARAANAQVLTEIETLKQLTIKGKIRQACDWVEDFLESDKKLVVFCTHRFTIDTLMKRFKNRAVRVDGSVTGIKRQEAIDTFQNDPRIVLFVGNIKAAGVGITLTVASSVAFLELPWTPGEVTQAEDRCHRIGQTDAVNVYFLLAEDTIEEKIIRLLDEKRKVLSQVLDGQPVEESSLLTELINSYQK